MLNFLKNFFLTKEEKQILDKHKEYQNIKN